MDFGALDRHITGNYGMDQDEVFCPMHGEECDGWHEVEDDRDWDSMPGGADYEEPDDSWLDSYWETD